MSSTPDPGAAPFCGVVVTYHPEPEVAANVAVMVQQCGRVIVVDNGSAEADLAPIAAITGVNLIALDRNEGLAAALNVGLERASELGFAWAVTLDQDSRPEAGMVQALWAMHLAHPVAAVVAPRLREAAGVDEHGYRWLCPGRWPLFFALRRCSEAGLSAVTIAVTSGCLTNLEEWQRLGRFDDGLFIDYIDIDYCLRVIRAGRTVAVAGGAVLHHRLGARQRRVLLVRDFRPMNHAPFRHYYMARNRVLVWRRHALAVPHWAVFDFCFAWYNLARVLVFENQRWAKLKAILRGTWHGVLGKTGPMP
jgi:rhamnosyltransferase